MAQDAIRCDDKAILVTGGAGGIGAATCRLLAARGAKLIIADIAFDRASELCEELPNATALHLDLEDEQSICSGVVKSVEHFGRIDALINIAALIDPKIAEQDTNIENMPTDLWDRTMAINLRGTMIACRSALPHLRKTRGNIVNIVSNLALQGHLIQAAYSTSKAALIQMTRAIAASHGKMGVRCNAVAPGMTMTSALKEAFPAPLREAVEEETLRDQLGEPNDIAQAIAFLASDAARNITGEVIVCDGGAANHVSGIGRFRSFFGEEV